MKLSFASSYKSIQQLPDIELPPFTVLVGLNGSGKSQLLQAISAEKIRCSTASGSVLSKSQIRVFTWANFLPKDENNVQAENLDRPREDLWNHFHGVQQQAGRQLIAAKKKIADADPIPSSLEVLPLFGLSDVEDLIGDSQKAASVFAALQSAMLQYDQKARDQLEQQFPGICDVLDGVMAKHSVPLLSISRQMFLDHCPFGWRPTDPFTTELTNAFAEYRAAEIQNTRNQLLSKRGNLVTYLEPDKFLAKHGQPPWDLINQILEASNLQFRISPPPVSDREPIQLKICHTSSQATITIADLSSGEQILLALARCLFFMADGDRILSPPKVVLLDEVDAPLHPAMTQQLIRTIRDVIVGQHGVNVILSTHSPATVALAPEESLFQMRAKLPRLQKISKEAALAELTEDLPTLSISYENRRQVFVESEYDARWYEPIFRKLRDHLDKEVSLHFIASGNGGSGCCDQVKTLVKSLREAGNRSVFGVVDWDLKNCGNEHVFVLGSGERYAIENYLFDPLLIAAYLFREKLLLQDDVGIANDVSHLNLAAKVDAHQLVVDRILARIKPDESESPDCEMLPCQYLCGSILQLPKWFLHMNGHALETSLKNAFPPLKRFQKEGDLKWEIVRKVVDDTPNLLSQDFVDLFTEIQGTVGNNSSGA